MKFVAGLRRGSPEKIGMRVRVIPDDVAAGYRFTEKFRMLAGELADDKKCGARFVAIEEIEELRCHRGVRTIVESDGELARRICMCDCGTENFRVGVTAGIGKKARSSGHDAGDDREVRIHADIFA